MSAAESVPSKDEYTLTASGAREFAAPDLPYRPRDPKLYHPKIALIGAGGITAAHLDAYRRAGYNVAAICDLELDRAELRRRKYFPEALATSNFNALLKRDDIEVFDIATHPAERVALIERAIDAGKHVLSQKPFVLDLAVGVALAERAERRGVYLAVNQNGRWAPYFAYIREAVTSGLIGDLQSVHVGVHWDHSWTAGTPFEDIDDLIFYDFAIHWFDFVATLIGDRATSVVATRARATGQTVRPPMLAQALIAFEGGQCSLVFDAHAKFGPLNTTYVAGTNGTLTSHGPDLTHQEVSLYTAAGHARPILEGAWFNDGFHGAMGELLCAVEEGREPMNSARNNLRSLALCFAAIASSHSGAPLVPGSVKRLPAFGR